MPFVAEFLARSGSGYSWGMPTVSAKVSSDQLPPFPEGWYFVASRDELRRAGLIEREWMGEQIVAWLDDDGQVCVSDAYCPHLGSHMGPAAGGRVCDGKLVCPFHGFEFDTTGQCVATPFAAPPRRARLDLYPTREIAGIIFAWYSELGREPQWELPIEEPSQEGWGGLRFYRVRFRGHPQETTENAVDLAHLNYVHGFANVEQVGPVEFDGAMMRTAFQFFQDTSFAKVPCGTFDVTATVTVHGLGYSFVEVEERTIGFNARLWTMATPIDGGDIEVVLGSQVRRIEHPRRRIVGMAFLPVRWRTQAMNWFVLSQEALGVRQDLAIWSNKKYRPRPRLCRSDGEIMAYRAYCAQFYPEAPAVESIGERVLQLSSEAAGG